MHDKVKANGFADRSPGIVVIRTAIGIINVNLAALLERHRISGGAVGADLYVVGCGPIIAGGGIPSSPQGNHSRQMNPKPRRLTFPTSRQPPRRRRSGPSMKSLTCVAPPRQRPRELPANMPPSRRPHARSAGIPLPSARAPRIGISRQFLSVDVAENCKSCGGRCCAALAFGVAAEGFSRVNSPMTIPRPLLRNAPRTDRDCS